MSNSQSPLQLSMNFGGDNPFAQRLREGKFSVLIECASPPSSQPFDSAVAQAADMARRLRDIAEAAGVAVTDRARSEDAHDPVRTATVLAEASAKPALLFISGKGSTADRTRDLLARASSSGVRTVACVTGDRSDRHVTRPGHARIARYGSGYLDSVEGLMLTRAHSPAFFTGAAVNPFKYNPADQYLQYFKMVRKLACGAHFLVANAGWDMKKLQELQWYLQMRDIGHPVIARLLLLSMDDIEVIHEGLLPGVYVARTFAAMLQRESNISAEQSLSAQLQRLGLQVAGCKLLGYSGVQIGGLRNTRNLDMVLGQIKEALATYTDYAGWVTAWNEFHSFLDFAPTPDAYYGFANLLSPGQQMFDPDRCAPTDRELPVATQLDRVRAVLMSALSSDRVPRVLRDAADKACRRICKAGLRRLRYCYYLCPGSCPKGLVYGPCGGSQPNGLCEFGHATCFFHRVLALASARHELDLLEEGPRDD